MNILDGLNERQKEAVLHKNGAMLVVAGAGSGKTMVLTRRIAKLIKDDVNPSNILAVTFTNKAAGEIQNRVRSLVNNYDRPMIGTFHSIGVRILKKHITALNREKNFTILDADDALAKVREICKEKSIPKEEFKPKPILNKISWLKNQLKSYNDFYPSNIFEEKVQEVYERYEYKLKQENCVDFDDLITLPVKIFQNFPKILDEYQENWKYIMIDEFQDTNEVQNTFATLLSEKYRNICAIGDSDQSIYAFRGANIQNILDFQKNFPEAKIIKLEQNYRSTQNILSSADSVIANNTERVKKIMFTENGDGERIIINEYRDGKEEAEKLALEIGKIKNSEDIKYNDFTILYRTNAQSRSIEEAFLKYSIPYNIIGGLKFYSRKEIKDIVAFLRLMTNEKDSGAFNRIVNVPPRKIGKVSLMKLEAFAQMNNLEVFPVLRHIEMCDNIQSGAKKSLSNFYITLNNLAKKAKEQNVSETINEIVNDFGLKDFYLDGGTEEGKMRIENINELISVAHKFDGIDQSLELFLEDVSLITDADRVEKDQDRVNLMTMHNAKGLEFPVVFIVGCEEELLPHSNSLASLKDIEEERRLMYVAMTRAMKKLHITYAKERIMFGGYKNCIPSRFLDEIPEECVKQDQENTSYESETLYTPFYEDMYYQEDEGLNVGDLVLHPSFGQGTVKNIQGDIVTIDFRGLTKRLALSIAPLQKLS
ncbi:MAG: ATP-dependent helicase [Candidatus Gracilibacteria bacterium]|jgi:DNA helicase-2/ATP-dependent DNA helicase PcrA|nr:ATP-dependent helicase [Candidatus Gracilibacteria bacterium]